jgi:CubicO group peptidase (beta-lactamase class C family)
MAPGPRRRRPVLRGRAGAPRAGGGLLRCVRSGIADDADQEADEDYEALWVDKPCYSVTETRHFLPQFVHKPPNFAPGGAAGTATSGTSWSAWLEEITGASYRDQVRRAVFASAGMSASDFYDRREPATNVAEGWEPVKEDGRITGWRQNIFSYPPIGSPDAGAHVTAYDLVRFLQAVRAGELLGPELTAEFLRPQVRHHTESDGVEVWHGFGLEFVREPDGTVRSYYKEGINPGVSGIICRLSHYWAPSHVRGHRLRHDVPKAIAPIMPVPQPDLPDLATSALG